MKAEWLQNSAMDDTSPTSSRRIDDLDLNERLHVDIGISCNNNCLFCMEEDRQGRAQRVGRLNPEDIRRILDSNVGRKEVVFVSGEPTLSPHFLDYVRHAHKAGYQRVGVISNGRRFAYAPFVVDCLRAGLNHVIISLHGPTPQVHDGLTRTPKSFEQALAGIKNLSPYRARGLRLDTSTVLTRRNCKQEILEVHLALLRPLVDQMVFNVIQPFGRGKTHFDSLVMRYREAAEELGRFFEAHAHEELPIFLVDIPYCTTEACGIPDRARGYVERYCHFEVSDAPKSAVVAPALQGEVLSGGAQVKQVQADPQPGCGPLADDMEGLVAKHRDAQEQTQKVKYPSCLECAYHPICDGVWANYVARYGFDEFVPVKRR